MTLYDATGTRHIALTSATIRACCDGSYFLAHGLELLPTIRLEPYCRHCAAAGLDARIVATHEGARVEWRCGHRAGFVRILPGLQHQPLLDALGWSLRCSDCQASADAGNHRADATFEVRCPCTTRRMANPLGATHDAAIRSAAMA